MFSITSSNLPALEGGRPVRDSLLPFQKAWITEQDMAAVQQALQDSLDLSAGLLVRRLEEKFAALVGSRFAVATSSGAAGLHIALMAGGIGPQEEVIVTSLTHPATTNCVLYQKAVPIFTDIDPATGNLDPLAVQWRLTERARAMIITHYGGFPAPLQPLLEIAKARDLLVVEDCTRAAGAQYDGQAVGRAGDMGVYSFSPANSATCGQAGIVVTDDEETYNWLAMFRDNGLVKDAARFTQRRGSWQAAEMQDLGFNYRLTEMQAALLLSQLERWEEMRARRERTASVYTKALVGRSDVELPRWPVEGRPGWNFYPVLLNLEHLRVSREHFVEALRAENVEAAVKYLPVYLQPYYLWIGHPDVCTITDSLCPRAEDFFRRVVCLPVYPAMTEQDAADVVTAVVRLLKYYAGIR